MGRKAVDSEIQFYMHMGQAPSSVCRSPARKCHLLGRHNANSIHERVVLSAGAQLGKWLASFRNPCTSKVKTV